MDCSPIVPKIKPSVALVVVAYPKTEETNSGSGFVFGETGVLVTCNHVVTGGGSIVVKFPDSEYISAKILIRDEEHDLALLKFDDNTRAPLSLADTSQVKEGMQVLFAGYPLNLGKMVTHQGILSTITEDVSGVITYLIDGSVNPGNSGGPLMNSEGEVIGVVNARRRERNELLEQVEEMQLGALSLHGVDIVDIYHALIKNLQLGIGYAVPASYIPDHKGQPSIMKEQKDER